MWQQSQTQEANFAPGGGGGFKPLLSPQDNIMYG